MSRRRRIPPSRPGSPLQDLLLDETARLADANVRDTLSRLPAPPAPLVQLLDPTGVLRASSPLLAKYEEDERVLEAASALAGPIVAALPATSDEWAALLRELAQAPPDGEGTEDGQAKLVRLVTARLWERRADWPVLASRLAARVVLRGIDRVDILAASATSADADAASASQAQFAAALVKGGLAAASATLLAVAPDATEDAATADEPASSLGGLRGVVAPMMAQSGSAPPTGQS